MIRFTIGNLYIKGSWFMRCDFSIKEQSKQSLHKRAHNHQVLRYPNSQKLAMNIILLGMLTLTSKK